MTTPITNYCTTDEIRSILGTSDVEVEDATILSLGYKVRLQERIYDISPNLATYYATLVAQVSRTVQEQRLVDLIKAYSAYVVAQALAEAGPLAMFQSLADSKAKIERTENPFEQIKESIAGSLVYLESRVTSLYTQLVPGAEVTPTTKQIFIVSVGIAVDPVTNV